MMVNINILIPKMHWVTIEWHIMPPLKTDSVWVFLTFFCVSRGVVDYSDTILKYTGQKKYLAMTSAVAYFNIYVV